MNADIRILPILLLAFAFGVDAGCILRGIPPFEAYGSPGQFLAIHGILGLISGLSIGSVLNDKKNDN